jgi:protein TonB
MLIAVFLAISLHMGLMNFEFAPEPISVPSVSLPRSVSVFLGQQHRVETPEQTVKKVQTVKAQTIEHVIKEQPAKKIEPQKTVPQKIIPAKEKTAIPVQQAVVMEKVVKKTAVEEITPASQKPKSIAEDIKPESGEAAKVQGITTQSAPQTTQKEEGTNLPGTLQMAFPRYRLNVPPTYPGLARKRGQEGTVILQVLVNKEGRVDDLKIDVSSNFNLLDRTAVIAVRKWSFEPGRRGDVKIPMWVKVPVTFKLKK